MFKQASIPLICTYDSEADAAYIYFAPPKRDGEAAHTVLVDIPDGMVNLDLDTGGHVLGIEVLGARSRLPAALLQAILNTHPTAGAGPPR